MKTAQLPPVRVEPAVREEIESVLLEGESLSQFVEASAMQAARRRKAQQAFLEHDVADRVAKLMDTAGASAEARKDPRLVDLMMGTVNQYFGLAGSHIGAAAEALRRALACEPVDGRAEMLRERLVSEGVTVKD